MNPLSARGDVALDIMCTLAASQAQRTLSPMPGMEAQEPAGPLPVSALVVPFTLPPGLARARRRWDYAALTGVGPHVTILFPFLPCADLGPTARAELAAIARAVPAFDVRFEQVRRFPDLVWVEPEPAAPFAALTAAVVARWPSHPAYEGAYDTVIPHLTVVESDVADIETIDEIARRSTPFARRAQRMELWCQDTADRWRTRWRMPLGVRP
jgi:2'-5' RNA ligase